MISAAVGCAALLVYAGLKANWAMGGEVGILDTAEWNAMLDGLTERQRFGAFWGTVVLDLAGAALIIALALSPRFSRGGTVRIMRGLAWTGGLLLTFAGVAGLIVSVAPAIGLWREAPGDPGPLADWVFSSFTAPLRSSDSPCSPLRL